MPDTSKLTENEQQILDTFRRFDEALSGHPAEVAALLTMTVVLTEELREIALRG